MVASAQNCEAVGRLLAALPESDAAGRARFEELGFPTPHDEDWRFTSIKPIIELDFIAAEADVSASFEGCAFTDIDGPRLVFVNGHFSESLSQIGNLPAGVEVRNLTASDLLVPHEAGDAFAALTAATFTGGPFISAAENVNFETPVRVYYLSTGSEGATANMRGYISAGANSKLTVLESWTGTQADYFNNGFTELHVADNAHVEHLKFQDEHAGAFHVGAVHATMGRDAHMAHHSIALGGRIARNNLCAHLNGTGVEAVFNGLYLPRTGQLIDHHMVVNHAQPYCNSHEYFNGILDDDARAVFHGRIHVHKGADKTDAKQTNKNLLLSDNATVNTKPQLEIYADDVKCTHGATIGHMNDEQIFYLRARGLNEVTARHMIMHAFAGEIIERIECISAREELNRLVWSRLEEDGDNK